VPSGRQRRRQVDADPILSGVHQPTTGTIEMDGAAVAFPTPRAAQEAGIATVHQFGGTFPLMSIGRIVLRGRRADQGLGSVQGL
jgi:simple sugar transport system ATP-binding protein